MGLIDKLRSKKKSEQTDVVKLIYKSHQLEDFLKLLSEDKRLSEEERKQIKNFKDAFEESHKSCIALLSGDAERWDNTFATTYNPKDLLNQENKREQTFPQMIKAVKKKTTNEEGKLLEFAQAAYERESELYCAFTIGLTNKKWVANFKTRPLSDFVDKYTLKKLKEMPKK